MFSEGMTASDRYAKERHMIMAYIRPITDKKTDSQ